MIGVDLFEGMLKRGGSNRVHITKWRDGKSKHVDANCVGHDVQVDEHGCV